MSQVHDVVKVMEEVAKVEMEEGGTTKVVLPKCIIFQHQNSSWIISVKENPFFLKSISFQGAVHRERVGLSFSPHLRCGQGGRRPDGISLQG